MRVHKLLFLLALLGPGPVASAEPTPAAALEIGIAPFLPARVTMQNYQPLRAHLERRLKQPVLLVTAPDYKTYFQRIERREYPLVITVAHSAWLAQTDSGYVPLLRPSIYTRPVLVVARGSTTARVPQLRGKSVALPEALALVAMQARSMLREAGLDPERDVSLQHFPNHAAAVNHVLAGEATAAIVSDRALQQMPAASRDGVRVVQSWDPGAQPGVVYLANPLLPRKRVGELQRAILEFTRDTAEGREFMERVGYGQLVPAHGDDLKPFAPYGTQLRAAVAKLPTGAAAAK
jgi:ABC-type phosphate/phosphonate transport system substrate-binding protein